MEIDIFHKNINQIEQILSTFPDKWEVKYIDFKDSEDGILEGIFRCVNLKSKFEVYVWKNIGANYWTVKVKKGKRYVEGYGFKNFLLALSYVPVGMDSIRKMIDG